MIKKRIISGTDIIALSVNSGWFSTRQNFKPMKIVIAATIATIENQAI
jgi:hypothetical protein